MEAPWRADDSTIPNSERLYRRVPRKPDFVVRDLVTGEASFLRGAFRYDCSDGMSVYRNALIQAFGLEPHDTIPSADSHTIAAFPVSCPRSVGAGVVDCLGDQLAWMKKELPECHATVRLPTPGQDKTFWGEVREELMSQAREV